jgi:hypothetical protein
MTKDCDGVVEDRVWGSRIACLAAKLWVFGGQALGVWWPSIGCLVAKDRVFGGEGSDLVAMNWVWWPRDWVWWPRNGFVGQGSGLIVKDRVLWPRIWFDRQGSGVMAKDLVFGSQGLGIWWPRIGFLGERMASKHLKTRKRGSCQN